MMEDTTESPVYLLPADVIAQVWSREILITLGRRDAEALDAAAWLTTAAADNLKALEGVAGAEERQARARTALKGIIALGALALQYKLQRVLRVQWRLWGWSWVECLVDDTALYAALLIRRNAWLAASAAGRRPGKLFRRMSAGAGKPRK